MFLGLTPRTIAHEPENVFQARGAETFDWSGLREGLEWDRVRDAFERAGLFGMGVGCSAAGVSLRWGARVARGELSDALTEIVRLAIPVSDAGPHVLLEKAVAAVVDHLIESGLLASVLIDRVPTHAAVAFVVLLMHETLRRQGGYEWLAHRAETLGVELARRGRAYRRLARSRKGRWSSDVSRIALAHVP